MLAVRRTTLDHYFTHTAESDIDVERVLDAEPINYYREAPARLPGLLSIPRIWLIYRDFSSEPPRTRTWNLEIKSLSQ